MKRCGEFFFIVFISAMFILSPVITFSAEKGQEGIIIDENEKQLYLQTFKGVIEDYIAGLEKEGIDVNREVVEKELNNLLQLRGPLELNEKELEEYINVNQAKIDAMLQSIMSKDTEQLLGGEGLLGGLGGGASNESAEVEVVNAGAPNQVDSLFNTLGRLLGGVYEGFLFGGPLGAGLGVALGLAVDAGLSMAVILTIAVVAGVILAIIVGIGALPAGVIIGAIAGAIIGALLFAIVAAVIFGGGTFLVVTLSLIMVPVINVILALAAAVVVGVIVAFLAAIVGGIIGLVGGGILGLVSVPVAAIVGGLAGAASGGLFGAVVAGAGQIILIPLTLFLGAIGFVLGLVGGPIVGGAVGLLNTTGMALYSTTIKTIESYGDDYVYNIDSIVKTILNEAKELLGPASYNKIKLIEIVVDTADFTTAEGINKATEEVLGMLPSLAN